MEPDFETSLEPVDQALGEIEYTMEQMQALAHLSANNLNVGRASLQNTLEHLQRKIGLITEML